MNKNHEINKILKTLVGIIEQTPYSLDSKNVYHYLTRYKIKNTEQNFKISNLFNGWITYFENIYGIKVFVQENWKYFCQFVNHQSQSESELINPIKMYISVDSSHIDKSAKLIFDFMAQNGIVHESKIGSDIRTDDIVIRVFSKEDSEKVHNFIKSNRYIRSGMNDILPFNFEKDGIGYALDGRISYNQTLAQYIANYLNNCKKNNTLKNVSLNNFYNYVLNIYNKVFQNKEGIDEYFLDFCNGKSIYSKEELLNNYGEVTFLLLASLRGEKLDKFMEYVEYFNDQEQLKNRVNFYKESVKQEISDLNKKLFDEYIIVMHQKYDSQMAYTTILEYIQTGNVERITKTNNLRERFARQMTPEKCSLIIENLSLKEYIERVVKNFESKLVNRVSVSNEAKRLFDEYIIVMYQKYEFQIAYTTILEYVQTGNVERITRTNNLRERFTKKLNHEIVKEIIENNLEGYINNVLNDTLYLTKTYLDKAIVATYQEYNDLTQVIIAVNNACYGNYNYFTNQNGERDLLSQYVNNYSIILLLKNYANSITKDYVEKCLANYNLSSEANFSK